MDNERNHLEPLHDGEHFEGITPEEILSTEKKSDTLYGSSVEPDDEKHE